MALLVCKNNTGTAGDINSYDPFSQGDGTDPLGISVLLDGTGGTVTSTVQTVYLVATLYNYTSISVTVINDTIDIDWQISLDNTTFTDTVTPAQMNALSADVVTPLYFRTVVNNDGTVGSQTFTTPKIRIEAVESSS